MVEFVGNIGLHPGPFDSNHDTLPVPKFKISLFCVVKEGEEEKKIKLIDELAQIFSRLSWFNFIIVDIVIGFFGTDDGRFLS